MRDIVGNMTFLEASSEGLDDTYRGMSMSTEKFDRFFSSEVGELGMGDALYLLGSS